VRSEQERTARPGVNEILVRAYGVPRLRGLAARAARKLEGGEFRSITLREIFARYWGVEIGLWTHGACFTPWTVDPQTTIGRYTSIADGARILNHNHPLEFKSTSGLFFNPVFGAVSQWNIDFRPKTIGNDVWIGANAVILPEVRSVGDGAVIGAGAVVNRDVPPYAVVLGNPGRVVKYRFDEKTIAALLAEKWWQKDLDDLGPVLEEFQVPHGAAAQRGAGAVPEKAEARRPL